ncbi:DUF2541 family protein [Kordia sp.]|uniref:DUF2541 family protein n=1 Tax=Kordia sp. TaxID=1965332 RepID=UPI0025C177D3|nr:DUF2541 family protein [Kordia sp.]MCH2195096.1 DUF2541 family protein [Kordia sp.]
MRLFATFILSAILWIGLSSFKSISTDTFVSKWKWEKLGSKKVNYKLDKDVIRLGKHEGTFKKLKLVVSKGALNMHRMVVHYGNGSKEEIKLRHNFNRRSNSRVIDLDGRNRIIKKITFIYDTKNNSKSRATVHVFGR